MIDHYGVAEQALAQAEACYEKVRTGEVDAMTENAALRDVNYDLAFAQAHMGLAQVQRYGQAAGAVETMADRLSAEQDQSPSDV